MFADGKFAKIWKIYPKDKAEQNYTDVQLSTSKKGKNGFETDFNDNARLIGEAHKKAAELEANDRIKITSCGVSNYYNKESRKKYYTFCIFDFSFVNDQKQAESNGEEWVDVSKIPESDLPFAD